MIIIHARLQTTWNTFKQIKTWSNIKHNWMHTSLSSHSLQSAAWFEVLALFTISARVTMFVWFIRVVLFTCVHGRWRTRRQTSLWWCRWLWRLTFRNSLWSWSDWFVAGWYGAEVVCLIPLLFRNDLIRGWQSTNHYWKWWSQVVRISWRAYEAPRLRRSMKW